MERATQLKWLSVGAKCQMKQAVCLMGIAPSLSLLFTGTFAVQGVNYSVDSQGALCIECLFLSGLSSSGCFVVVSKANGQGSVMVQISRSNDAQSAVGCSDSFATGVYNFAIHDVLNNGQKQDTVAFEKDNVTIVIPTGHVESTTATTTEEPSTICECASVSFRTL